MSSTARLDALDGIRTIAVFAVVLFHVSTPGMSAGFAGVDVFFVLSGYLITGLLLREADRHDRIDLPRFWSRRVLRLMPAALVVIGIVIAWSTRAPAYRHPDLAADAVASLLYVGNWRFISSASYFSADGTTSPLQHVWSLAVEEQFYVVWPVLISLVLLVLSRRVPRGPDRHRRLAAAVAVAAVALIVVSALLLATLYDPEAPDRAYMGTDSKVFEPLLGGLGAVLATFPVVQRFASRFASVLVAAGAAGLVWGLATLSHGHGPTAFYFRGGALLFCVFVLLLVLGAAHSGGTGLARLLAWGPMAYLGRISYGIYLWHWPLAVWAGVHQGWNPLLSLLVVVATVAFSALSYRFLEAPLRFGRPRHWRPGRVLGIGATALSAVVLSTGALSSTATGSRGTWVVVGDSVPKRLVPALAPAGEERGITILSAAKGSCSAMGNTLLELDGHLNGNIDCATIVPELQRSTIEKAQPKVVLWWSRYELIDRRDAQGKQLTPPSPQWWAAQEAELKTTVARLTATGARLVIVLVDRVGVGMQSRCTPERCTPFLIRYRDDEALRLAWNARLVALAASDPRHISTITMDDLYCRTAASPCDDRMPLRTDPSRSLPNLSVAAPASAKTAYDDAARAAFPPPDVAAYPPPVDALARPDGVHFSDTALPRVAAVLLDRALEALR